MVATGGQLAVLTISNMARRRVQPASGAEEQIVAGSKGSLAALEVTRKILRGCSMMDGIEKQHTCTQNFSALEYLASAAAAQRVSSI